MTDFLFWYILFYGIYIIVVLGWLIWEVDKEINKRIDMEVEYLYREIERVKQYAKGCDEQIITYIVNKLVDEGVI